VYRKIIHLRKQKWSTIWNGGSSLQSFDHCVSFHPHANHTLTHTCGVLHTYMINSINYIFFIFFKREHMLLWKPMQTMTKTSSKFTQKITHVDDMMIHNLVKYLVKIRLRLWDINITKFCQNIWTTFWLETRLFFLPWFAQLFYEGCGFHESRDLRGFPLDFINTKPLLQLRSEYKIKMASTTLGNSVVKLHQIRTRELQSLPTKKLHDRILLCQISMIRCIIKYVFIIQIIRCVNTTYYL
jgi:hypothetical protein